MTIKFDVFKVFLNIFRFLLFLNLATLYWVSADNPTMGEAIQGSGRSIYLLKNGTKHHVTSFEYFLQMGYSIKDVHRYTDSIVDSYPLGEPIAPPPPPSSSPIASVITDPTEWCPCRSSSSHDLSTNEKLQRETAKSHTICLLRNERADFLERHRWTDHLNTNVMILSSEFTTEYYADSSSKETIRLLRLAECDVLLSIVNGTGHESSVNHRQCPGVCVPVPFLEVPWTLLHTPMEGAGVSTMDIELYNSSLTCSLTVGTAHTHAEAMHIHHHTGTTQSSGEKAHHERTLGFLLRAIARRRLEECTERGLWPLGSFSPPYNANGQVDSHSHQHTQWTNNTYLLPHKSNFPKRPVWGLIIWVGSTSKMNLSIAQTEMLRIQNESTTDDDRIIGWVATEEQYPCRPNNANCPHTYGYHWLMPSGKMFYLGGSGWGCAQRRQLRAMAHALLLYEPQFLLVVDDDSWVNVKLLLRGSPLSHLISSHMTNDAIVLGQMTGGNKVTKSGFFYGGAGYLMGPRVIAKLNAHVLDGPSYYPDSIRDAKQMAHLGLMETVATRVNNNPKCGDCMKLERAPNPPGYQDNIGVLQVPLVEICTNLLSEAGTCYHSDHAMTVCLVHGAYAEVWDAKCWGYKTRDGMEIGMCMGTDYCNTTLHLTCHRFMPDISKPDLPPIAASARRSYFRW